MLDSALNKGWVISNDLYTEGWGMCWTFSLLPETKCLYFIEFFYWFLSDGNMSGSMKNSFLVGMSLGRSYNTSNVPVLHCIDRRRDIWNEISLYHWVFLMWRLDERLVQNEFFMGMRLGWSRLLLNNHMSDPYSWCWRCNETFLYPLVTSYNTSNVPTPKDIQSVQHPHWCPPI